MNLTAGKAVSIKEDEDKPRTKEWSLDIIMAAVSVLGLVGVAVTKTLWTKAMFTSLEFHFPIITCAISCAVTILVLGPVFMIVELKPVPRGSYLHFAVIAAFTSIDLACMNLGLDRLDISVQQALNAATPAAVIMFEMLFFRKIRSVWVYLPFLPLISGSVLTTLASGSHRSSPSGVFFMIIAIFSGALKAITTHDFLVKLKNQMGVLSFLFWLDIVMLSFLLPAAYVFEEFDALLQWPQLVDSFAWVAIISNGLFGGVRAWLVKLVLKYNTALTKVVCDVIIKASTIGLSILIFGNTVTTWMIVGIFLTLSGFSLYTAAALKEKTTEKKTVKATKGRGSKSPEPMVAEACPEAETPLRRRVFDDVEGQPLLDSPQHAERV